MLSFPVPSRIAAAALILLALQGNAASAQNKLTSGPVSIDYHQFVLSQDQFHLFGGIRMTSANFDLSADDVKVTISSRKTAGAASSIQKAALTGGPATDGLVKGRFEDVAQGRTYRIQSDQAVYLPDGSRPGGGRVDFTGHVLMTILAPIALAEPSLTTVDHLTIFLGQGPSYPRIEGDQGHTVLTPLH